jgi:hypothetical protein
MPQKAIRMVLLRALVCLVIQKASVPKQVCSFPAVYIPFINPASTGFQGLPAPLPL